MREGFESGRVPKGTGSLVVERNRDQGENDRMGGVNITDLVETHFTTILRASGVNIHLPIADIDPVAKFKADLFEVCDFFHTQAFV